MVGRSQVFWIYLDSIFTFSFCSISLSASYILSLISSPVISSLDSWIIAQSVRFSPRSFTVSPPKSPVGREENSSSSLTVVSAVPSVVPSVDPSVVTLSSIAPEPQDARRRQTRRAEMSFRFLYIFIILSKTGQFRFQFVSRL